MNKQSKEDGTVLSYDVATVTGRLSVPSRATPVKFVATCFYAGRRWRHPQIGERVEVVFVQNFEHPLAVFATDPPRPEDP